MNAMLPRGEEIAVQLQNEQLTSRMAQQRKKIAQDDYERLKMCEKIFEPLQQQRSTLTGAELAKLDKSTLNNPLF